MLKVKTKSNEVTLFHVSKKAPRLLRNYRVNVRSGAEKLLSEPEHNQRGFVKAEEAADGGPAQVCRARSGHAPPEHRHGPNEQSAHSEFWTEVSRWEVWMWDRPLRAEGPKVRGGRLLAGLGHVGGTHAASSSSQDPLVPGRTHLKTVPSFELCDGAKVTCIQWEPYFKF